MDIFFKDEDYEEYIRLMSEWCEKRGVEIWAYCLMKNHLHLIAVPEDEDGLRLAVGEAHRRYTRHVNFREKWRGYLFQGRFGSCPMDEKYLYEAVRYVENNPVKAGLVKNAAEYRWSSARAHMDGKDDDLVKAGPMLERVDNWVEYLAEKSDEEMTNRIIKSSGTGRPVGSIDFIRNLQETLGRKLLLKKPGRKKKVVEK